jgi:hypothetical protein
MKYEVGDFFYSKVKLIQGGYHVAAVEIIAKGPKETRLLVDLDSEGSIPKKPYWRRENSFLEGWLDGFDFKRIDKTKYVLVGVAGLPITHKEK